MVDFLKRLWHARTPARAREAAPDLLAIRARRKALQDELKARRERHAPRRDCLSALYAATHEALRREVGR